MTQHQAYNQAKKHVRLLHTLNLTVLSKAAILLTITGIVLYAVLFTTYPPVHDYFHEMRHGLMMIPCH
ncbi:MAG: CbtB-domain containing protein [bacterium]|nr:CbtB-domain containing protein [bacterium]